MSRVEIREDRCKGCLLCTLVCPEGILIQGDKINSKGYKVISVDQNKRENCRGCAFCAEICPDLVFVVFKDKKVK